MKRRKECAANDCAKPAVCRTFCNLHYQRLLAHGDPNYLPPTVAERFLSRVDRSTGSCWMWRGALSDTGYGALSVGNRRIVGAHRYSYQLFKGEIPAGKLVRHTCDNPPCVNPEHLEVGTDKDNANDRDAQLRQAWGEASGRARLTANQVRQIVNSRGSATSLAPSFGISPSHFNAVRRGDFWRHLTHETSASASADSRIKETK